MTRVSRTSKRPDPSSSGGIDAAQVVLRTALGGTMIAHGIRHARSLDGTAGWFGSIGFREPRLQAQLSSVVEIGAGSALVLGMATPIAASAVVGTMAVAAETVHRPNGYFIVNEGWEYVGFISAAAIALAGLGAGRASVDRKLGLDDRLSGLPAAAIAGLLGLAGAAIQLRTFWTRPQPE